MTTEDPTLPWGSHFSARASAGVSLCDPFGQSTSSRATRLFETACEWTPEHEERPEPQVLTRSGEPPSIVPSSGDCFSQTLPPEMCFLIAEFLSIEDLKNVAVVSLAFFHVWNQQRLWQRVFDPHGERGWLSEAQTWAPQGDEGFRGTMNWSVLYYLTRHEILPPLLMNKFRIWGLAQLITGFISPRQGVDSVGPPEPDSDTSARQWSVIGQRRLVSSEIWQYWDYRGSDRRFTRACRQLHSQTIAVPDSVSSITVYFNTVEPVRFISGFKLIGRGDQGTLVKSVGYQSTNFESVELEAPAAQLRGIRVCMTIYGIEALQFSLLGIGRTAWFGYPSAYSKSHRLVFQAPITHLTAGFDVGSPPSLSYLYKSIFMAANLRNTGIQARQLGGGVSRT